MFPPEVLQALVAHAREGYPEEVCGVVVRLADGRVEARRLANVQNRLHAADPATHPRDARTAYQFDPAEFFRIQKAEMKGELGLVAIYHSHCDVGAYFSATDRREALGLGDTPPCGTWLVLSARGSGVDAIKRYDWDAAHKEFAESDLPLAGGGAPGAA